MIDTNLINQAGDVVQAAKAQWSINGPALALAAALVARELRNFNAWVAGLMEFVIRHGGIGWLFWKFIWNPPKADHLDSVRIEYLQRILNDPDLRTAIDTDQRDRLEAMMRQLIKPKNPVPQPS